MRDVACAAAEKCVYEGEVMGLLDFLLRRKPAIETQEALADFVDEQAAFLVQKGIYDYSRARSGHRSEEHTSELQSQR